MAEVTGSFGAEQIQLNNAATEVTLKQLLAVTTAMAKSGAGSSVDPKKLQAELDKLTKQYKAGNTLSKKAQKEQDAELKKRQEIQDALDKHAAAEKRAAEKTDKYIERADMFSKGLQSVTTRIAGMVNSVANMGNSFSGAAGVLGELPLIGGLIGPVFGAIASSGDRVYKTFQQSASVGANFNGSIRGMITAASGAGLTIDQFSSIIAKNSESLALLGGSSSEGAKRLAQLGKAIRGTPLQDSLARLGYSAEDINTGFARYSGMLAKSTGGQKISNAELIKQTGDYLKNLDAVSKLTGKSKEALQAEEDARRRDAQYRIAERLIRKEDRKNLDMFMNSLEPSEAEAFKEMLATGTLSGKASQDLMAMSPQIAQEMLRAAQAARQSGQFTEQSAFALDKNLTTAAKAAQNNAQLNVAGAHLADEYGKTVVGTLDRAARTGTLEEQRAKQVADEIKNRGKANDALDPAAMLKAQQNIAEASNKFTQTLAEQLPKLTQAFDELIKHSDLLIKAFQFVMNNFGKIAVIVGAISAFVGLRNILQKIVGTMNVKAGVVNVDGAGGDGGMFGDSDGKKKKGAKGRARDKRGRFKKAGKLSKAKDFLSSAKNVGRVGGAISAGLAIADVASEFSDIDEQVAEGKITEKEATKAKAVAGGKAAGTAAGGWGGAAAGAALGTMIFPGVGTVIGGAIGGALGAWGGEVAGEAAAEALTSSDPAKLSLSSDDKKKAKDWAWSVFTQKNSMSNVPIGLRQEVSSILKNPPGNWKSVFEAQKTQQAKAAPVANVDSMKKDMVSEIQKMKDAGAKPEDINKAVQAQAAKLQEATKLSAVPTAAPAGQNTPETLMASLNTKLDQMIKLNIKLIDINEKQLNVQRNLGGDVYAA